MMNAWNITTDKARILQFVKQYSAVLDAEGMQGIGLEKDGELLAGVLYEGFNGVNVWMHVGAVPGKRWMTKNFLRMAFLYPFVQLKCSRVSGYVEASNMQARKFDEHLGFTPEAILKGAASDGGDVILYVMRKKDCRYVHSK